MKLFFHPLSSYSQKTLMAFYEKNVPFVPELVQLMEPAARAEYKKLYPLGKLPLLQLENGRLIPESSIIIEYIDTQVDSGPTLIPFDIDLGRRTRFHDRQFDFYVNNPMMTILFDGLKPPEARNPAAVAQARETLDTMYPYLDELFGKRTYALGDTFTMADCAAAPALAYCRMVHPFDGFKHLSAYSHRLAERPSFARVQKEAAPYLEAMMGGAR